MKTTIAPSKLSTAEYFHLLYGDDPPGHLVLWTLEDKRTAWCEPSDLEIAGQLATTLAESCNTYHGIALQDQAAALTEATKREAAKAEREGRAPQPVDSRYVRGFNETAIALPGLFYEIDLGGPNHQDAHKKGNLPTSVEAAREAVAEFALPPTLTIVSGHGMYFGWLFKELWTFDTADERDDAADLAWRFKETLHAIVKAHGWDTDTISDFARVIRPVGTLNRKLAQIVPVELVDLEPTRRYSLDAFDEYLLDVTGERIGKAQTVELPTDLPAVNVDDPLFRLKAPPWLPEQIKHGNELVRETNPATGEITERRRFESRSETIWNVMLWLVRCGHDDAAVASIFLDPRYAISEKAREKKDPRGWLAPQIAKAKEEVKQERREIQQLTEATNTSALKITIPAPSSNGKVEHLPSDSQPSANGTAPTTGASGSSKQAGPGLTKLLSDVVLTDDHFAQDAGGDLYVYRDGTYRRGGDKHIRRRCQEILEATDRTRQWTTKAVNEVVEYIRTKSPELWERPPLEIVNVKNGLLNTATGFLEPHSPRHLSPVQLPVAYSADAVCPTWERFAAEVLPADTVELVWEIAAWLMAPDTSIQKAVLFLGEGSNGKSTLLRALITFLGRGNTAGISLHKLESDKFASARLVGKLANICPDLPSAHLAGTSMFKALTGGDVILAEHKYRTSFEFEPFARLLFSANHPPRSEDASYAFFRRWVAVTFPNTFTSDPNETHEQKEAKRRDLDAALADSAELSGVLNKALAVLPRVREYGLMESESMREAWQELRATTDPLAIWLDTTTIEQPDAYVSRDTLRKAYYADCMVNGRPTLSPRGFALQFKRLRPKVGEAQRTIGGERTWCYLGIGLLERPSPARDAQDAQDSTNCFVSQPSEYGTDGTKRGDGESNNRCQAVHPVQAVQASDRERGEL